MNGCAPVRQLSRPRQNRHCTRSNQVGGNWRRLHPRPPKTWAPLSRTRRDRNHTTRRSADRVEGNNSQRLAAGRGNWDTTKFRRRVGYRNRRNTHPRPTSSRSIRPGQSERAERSTGLRSGSTVQDRTARRYHSSLAMSQIQHRPRDDANPQHPGTLS